MRSIEPGPVAALAQAREARSGCCSRVAVANAHLFPLKIYSDLRIFLTVHGLVRFDGSIVRDRLCFPVL
jgi:hypothetical protein